MPRTNSSPKTAGNATRPKPPQTPTDATSSPGPSEAPVTASPSLEPTLARMSALEAAAKVLEETGEPMTTGALIEAMAIRKYWMSPNGATPAATLYSAILREIATKGTAARFQKTGRGQFARRTH